MVEVTSKKAVTFKEWTFYPDVLKTGLAYLTAEQSKNFVPCDCLDCQNLRAQIHTVFPQEVKDLLAQLGISYCKYAENVLEEITPEGCLYSIWFHFKGRFEGPDWYQQSSEGDRRIVFTPITERCQLRVHEDDFLCLIGDDDDVVQLDFEVTLPWVLDVPPPQ